MEEEEERKEEIESIGIQKGGQNGCKEAEERRKYIEFNACVLVIGQLWQALVG